MSVDDSSTVNPDLTQQLGPSTSQRSSTNTSPTGARLVGSDTGIHESSLSTGTFRGATLAQGREILNEHVPYLICLPMDRLWNAYSLNNSTLMDVKTHLVDRRWLSGTGQWGSFDGEEIEKERFETRGKGKELKTFMFFSHLFNAVLEFLQGEHGTTVETMVHAGAIQLKSTRATKHRPDAFLQIAASEKNRWMNLTCPFEYKFGDGGAGNVSHT